MRQSREQTADSRNRYVLFAFCCLLSALCFAVETPPRLFFSDARLSAVIPPPWEVPSSFPFGPMLTRKTQEGTEAFIVCQISDPVDRRRLSADVSTETLKTFATQDIAAKPAGARILAALPGVLAGQNSYEVTWLNEGPEGVTQYQSVYFFMENRFYVLSLRANRDSFPWIVQDFQTWLATVQLLNRHEAGKVDAPAHGGLWVHQTGGAKIPVPEDWLIGVADDRQVGATLARDKMHLDFSAVVDVSSNRPRDFTLEERETARKALEAKDYKIISQSEEPFHGRPAFTIIYEGAQGDRFIRGEDLWVAGAKARWLISLEGDSRLLRQLADEWQGLLSNIYFFNE